MPDDLQRSADADGVDESMTPGVGEPLTPEAEEPPDLREAYDIPEWVSEVRRLYVEPKTRARLREEGAGARHRRLPGIRPSRRGAPAAPAAPPAALATPWKVSSPVDEPQAPPVVEAAAVASVPQPPVPPAVPAEPLAETPGGPAVPAAAAHLADEPADPQVAHTDAGAPAGAPLSNGSGAHGRSDIWVPPTWTSARAATPVQPAVAAAQLTTPAGATASAVAAAVDTTAATVPGGVTDPADAPEPVVAGSALERFAMTVDETQVREAVQPASPAPGSAPSGVDQDPQLPAPTAADDEETHAPVGLAALAGSVEAAPAQAPVADAGVDAAPESSTDQVAHAPVGLAALAATGEAAPAQVPVADGGVDAAPESSTDQVAHAPVGLAALAATGEAAPGQAPLAGTDADAGATAETSDEETHAPVGLAALAATGEDAPGQARAGDNAAAPEPSADEEIAAGSASTGVEQPTAPADADLAPTLTMPAVASANGAAPAAEGTPPVAVEPAAPATAAAVEQPTTVTPEVAPVEQPSSAAEPAAVAAVRTHQAGRPHTVPSVNLSWREADSLDLGVPTVDDNEGAIVLEPPSQLVADTRRRSGHRHHTEDLGPEDGDVPSEGTPADPSDLAADVDANESPSTRAASRAAARDAAARKVRLRRMLVIVAVLLVLAVIGWLVLRGGGSGTAGPGGSGSGSSTVAALASAQATPAGD